VTSILHDLRYCGRTLARNPGFTASVVCTLALGIGTNTAIFSIVSGLLLKPLPFPHPEELVRIVDDLPGTGLRDVGCE
jgi:hypothetical protein